MIRCERCNAAIAQGWVVYVDGKPYHKNCAEIRNTMDERTTDALVAAVAMGLYKYNVAPMIRAVRIQDHFDGACAPLDVLLLLIDEFNWATEMAAPTALVYMDHALERYRSEAEDRVRINLEPFDESGMLLDKDGNRSIFDDVDQ